MLVSIIVATYNCARYIETTLESVYRQTYNDIELIVTDDCSTDNTVAITNKWIESHKNRFIRIVLTSTDVNSGVTDNYNTGLKEAKGEWIKCLDGDDMLPEDAIETYVNYCTEDNTITVWYAHELPVDDNGNTDIINKSIIPQTSVRKQMVFLLNHRLLGICTATNFIHRKTFVAQGGFDRRFPMYQDGSPFLQALAEGNTIGVVDRVTLYKRQNPDSLMHTANPIMVQNIRDCHFYYCRYYLRYLMPFHYYNAWVTHWLATHEAENGLIKATGYFLRCFDIVNLFKR